MQRLHLHPVALGLLVVLPWTPIWAQTPPDAGSVLQQIEKDFKSQLPRKSQPQFMPPPPMQSLGGETVVVKHFRFSGNSLLSDAQLAPLVSGHLNRPLDLATLQNVAIQVAAAYRRAGWIVSVYLPEQDIVDGIVTLQIIEAKLGAVRLQGSVTRVPPDQVKKLVEASQPLGLPLNGEALDRALLLIDDLPGVSATGRLSEGQNHSETDLVLAVTDSPLLSGELAADNTGSRATGAERLAATVSVSSPAKFGDQASFNLLHTRGSNYVRGAYTLPVGFDGWRIGVNAAHLSYKVLTLGLTQFDGTSTSTGLEASYPLLRSRAQNAYLSFALDRKNFDNFNAGAVTSKYKSQSASVSLNGNMFDDLGGGGATTASLGLVMGHLDLSSSPTEAADAASTQAAGSFRKIRFAAGRQQALTNNLALYASVSGQQANKNLDSSEKIYLGGVSGVRAYPANEGGGTLGHILNLELRARLPSNFSVVGFYDHGSVAINKNNNFAGATVLNRFDLKGVGVSVGWTSSYGLSVRASLARRMGNNPNPTSTGSDQDGSLTKNRIWLQVSLPL